MNTFMKTFLLIMILVIFGASNASAELTAIANHDNIEVNYNYHGSTVSVKGSADPDVDLVVKISSPDAEMKLMRKDKVVGMLWMNVEALHFKEVPGLYMLRSTKAPEDILESRERTENAIGFAALEEASALEPEKDAPQKSTLFEQFLMYMKSRKLYRQSTGEIQVSRDDAGRQNYYTLFDWPYQAAPGSYDVTVYAVKDGRVVETAQSKVTVAQTGFVKFLSSMARNNAAMYGIVSIILALAAGFGVGLIFGKDGGAH